MRRIRITATVCIAAVGLLMAGGSAAGDDPTAADADGRASITWDEAVVSIQSNRGEPIELAEAVIRIEVNASDQDAGFQIFLDGDGWRQVWVFEPDGRMILQAKALSGIREIGGGTELFLETEEPEYEDEEEFDDLIELLDEGDYRFLARTTENEWAVGIAELTHVVPAGPELVYPVPDPGEDCAEDVPAAGLVIDWHPVTTRLFGDPGITIVAYEVIVESEDTGAVLDVIIGSETTAMSVPIEFLEPGMEYSFEVLAVEESGNQTITESCFVTAE